MIKPMKMTLKFDPPVGKDWVYETKYDGYRILLYIDEEINLITRTGKNITNKFPEIKKEILKHKELLVKHLPLILDGELCYLDNPFKGSFKEMQSRGRQSNTSKIDLSSKEKPCTYLGFDLVVYEGRDISSFVYTDRKKILKDLLKDIESNQLKYIPYYTDYMDLRNIIEEYDGEGIVAKKLNSKWVRSKISTEWIKLKNWKINPFIITGYNKTNGYFTVSVVKNNQLKEVGVFRHGLKEEERAALINIISKNYITENDGYITVHPGICVELKYLELYDEILRQPMFERFKLDMNLEDCTWENLILHKGKDQNEKVTFTNLQKPLWKHQHIIKADYINYLDYISPLMLPHLKNKLLTVVRYPHGEGKGSFYQKNCPNYAPAFISTVEKDNINYIVCNDKDTLLWLGNQLSFEFHVPFETIDSNKTSEIVFDLDPPSIEEFELSIKAAKLVKEICDSLYLTTFVKTSGNKGIQVYIPLKEDTFTYEQTRMFISFIANYMTTEYNNICTTERLKKNRNGRLYFDYIQHAPGKTIIAPYSIRGTDKAPIATPLYWDEVKSGLNPTDFNLKNIKERIEKLGDPWKDYTKTKEGQQFENVLRNLRY